jgi:hypothetical protein
VSGDAGADGDSGLDGHPRDREPFEAERLADQRRPCRRIGKRRRTGFAFVSMAVIHDGSHLFLEKKPALRYVGRCANAEHLSVFHFGFWPPDLPGGMT